ncbi:hypothetical protein FGRMN_48 [Fusarium graminum]|nr:hypothetical protein FGRMN_48 [Fusarium graminum]
MSPASSPSRDITELFSRRRGINVPSDQKDLLNGPGSWAVELNNQPHSRAHIPGHVLETVKANYVARKLNLQERTPSSKKRRASPKLFASSKRMRNGDATTPKPDFEKPPASSPERSIPWSPSPPRQTPGLEKSKEPESIASLIGATTQSSIVHETPKTDTEGPAPQRTFIPLVENPPSSEESEDDLETRIPDAQPHPHALINRTALPAKPTVPSPLSTNRTMATPPCAQPSNPTQAIVPDTIITNKGSLEENASLGNDQPKTRLTFKPISIGDVGKKRKKSHNEKERLPPTIMPPVIDSSYPSSDSVIPNTYNLNVPTTQESIRESIEGNEEDEPTDNIEEIVPSTNNQSLIVERHSAQLPRSAIKSELLETEGTSNKVEKLAQQPVTPSQMGSPNTTPLSTSRSQLRVQLPLSAPLRIAPGAPLEPYDMFVQQYPAYAGDDGGRKLPGTKLNFVTACVYLNYLRSNRLLRDCLYDDFIRAFPCYYKKYVDHSGESSLYAIDWFNEQTEPAAYDKYLVNRGNLGHILRSYPEEFARVNETYLKGKEREREDERERQKRKQKQKKDESLIIYTSSEDEGDLEEDRDPSSPVSRLTNHSSHRIVESLGPITAIESDRDIELPRMPLAPQLNSTKRKASIASIEEVEVRPKPVTKPQLLHSTRPRRVLSQGQPPRSSRAGGIQTQAPPPPSPKIPQTSMLPPSTLGTSATKPKALKHLPYFDKIPSSSPGSSTPARRTKEQLDRMRKAFIKSNDGMKRVSGTKAWSARSSSGRAE